MVLGNCCKMMQMILERKEKRKMMNQSLVMSQQKEKTLKMVNLISKTTRNTVLNSMERIVKKVLTGMN